MQPDDEKFRNRYDVSGNPEAEYVDEAHEVLANKLGIADLLSLQVAEERALARAYESLLGEVRFDSLMNVALICHIHERIFGELYEWAGKLRTVWISKPGTTGPPPDFLHQAMQELDRTILQQVSVDALATDVSFCAKTAMIQGEFLVIHPFREGNARTIKLFTDLLALQSNRPILNYDTGEEGTARYIEAAKAAFKRDYSRLEDIIRRALEAGRA